MPSSAHSSPPTVVVASHHRHPISFVPCDNGAPKPRSPAAHELLAIDLDTLDPYTANGAHSRA